MSAGLPVLSSSFGPMPEILKESGIYCNPLCAADIAGKLEIMLRDEELRNTLSCKAFAASVFEWRESSRETFDFLYQIALENTVKA